MQGIQYASQTGWLTGCGDTVSVQVLEEGQDFECWRLVRKCCGIDTIFQVIEILTCSEQNKLFTFSSEAI